MQVQQFARATLTHRQWHLNYYHSIAESVLDVYNLACIYFQLCNLHTKDDIIPIFLDRPGVAGWDARLGVTEGGWRQVLPPAAEALQCFYPKPALWVADPMLHDKVQTFIPHNVACALHHKICCDCGSMRTALQQCLSLAFRLTEADAKLCMQGHCCLQNAFSNVTRAAIPSMSKRRKTSGARVATGNSACLFNPKSAAIDTLKFLLMVQVVVIKTAVVGIGPYNRKWPGPPETADMYGKAVKDCIAVTSYYAISCILWLLLYNVAAAAAASVLVTPLLLLPLCTYCLCCCCF